MRNTWIALTLIGALAGCNNSTTDDKSATNSPASQAQPVQVAATPAPKAAAPEAPAVEDDGVPTVCRSAAEAKRQCALNVATKYDAQGKSDAAGRTRSAADMVFTQMMGQWKARHNKTGLQGECERLLNDLKNVPACQ
jgi:hypothetical protein